MCADLHAWCSFGPLLRPTVATLLQRIGIAGSATILLVALVINGVVGYRAVEDQSTAFEEMYQAQRLLRRLSMLQLALSDAETGQRGFLLSGDASYLGPFEEGRRATLATLDTLDLFTRPFADKQARMPTVRRLATAKLAEMDSLVALGRAGRFADAIARLREGRGKTIMDSLRAETDVMVAGATARRNRDVALAERASRHARQTIVVSSLALLLLVGVIGWYLRRTLLQRARSAADLARANASLSQALAERESALASVQAMQAQLVQQEKLAGLGRLTAGVAHELKNPLNFVNNFAQLSDELAVEVQAALDAGRPDEALALLPDLRLNTAKVLSHGQRADEIVRTMLVHARGVSGERQAVGLDALLAQAAEQAVGPAEGSASDAADAPGAATAAAPDGVRPVTVETMGETGVEVWGVPSALSRMFLNVIENAVHAVRERAGLVPDPGYTPTIWLGVERGRDRMGRAVAVVTVADNGSGIPDTALPRIFEPFYTTKAPGQGTGLGLSLAYDIAVGHGGTLAAGRADAGGALITVTLPTEPQAEAGE